MTFEEAEALAPNGFHDAKIDKMAVDHQAGVLSMSMRLWVGTMGMPNQEDYSPAELRINRLLFCSIEPPDPRYPFAPDGDSLGVDGAHGLGDLAVNGDLIARLPPDVSLYRFFVDEWNSFIYIAGSDIQLSLGAAGQFEGA